MTKDEVKDMPILCVMLDDDGRMERQYVVNSGNWDDAMVKKAAQCLYRAFSKRREKERKGEL